MKIGDIALNVGDSIRYTRFNGDNRTKPKHREGEIISLAGTIITVDLGKYRDSFSLQDLACGVVEIPGLPKIGLTTSEANTPYRNPLKAELLRETEPNEKEEKKTMHKNKNTLTPPSLEELKEVWESSGHVVNKVMKHYKVSWPTAKQWLMDAGLLKPDATQDKPPEKAEETCTKEDPLTVNFTDTEPMPYVVVRLPNGNVNWDVVWPIVQDELDKGRDKYEIADELKIGRDAMKDKVKRMLNKEVVKPKPTKPDSPSPLLKKPMSRSELLSKKSELQAEGQLIDYVLSCIDKTLTEVRADAV